MRTIQFRVIAALMTVILFAGGLLALPSQGQAGGMAWTTVGTAGFSAGEAQWTKSAGYNGTPYVAFKDVANGNKLTVMKYDGSQWTNVGNAGFTSGTVNEFSFQMDASNGTPYIAYSDSDNGSKLTVMKYNGSSWVSAGNAAFSPGSVNSPSLSIRNSVPYVAYFDLTTLKVAVQKYDGTNWNGVGTFPSGNANSISLYVDSRNGVTTPYVAYQDGAFGRGNKATVQKFDGSSWVTVGSPAFSDGQANSTTLSIDESNGTLYICYIDYGHGGKLTLKKYSGSSWESVGGDGFTSSIANSPTLQIYDGHPYVLYQDYTVLNKATLSKYNGSTWETVGIPGFSGSGAQYPSLYEDGSSGAIYAAFSNTALASKLVVMTPYELKSAPALSADTTGNKVNTAIELSFTEDADWRSAITAVKSGATVLRSGTQYTVSSGNITLAAGVLQAGTYTLTISATGYDDAAVSQTVNAVYKITYYGNGHSSGSVPMDSGTYVQGELAAVKGNTGSLTRTGYTFAGWNTLANGTGTTYAAAADLPMGAANVELYAKWILNQTYSITALPDQTAAALTVKYAAGAQETRTVTVNRTGTGDLANVTAALSGAGAADFELTQPANTTLTSLVPTTTFTVKAKDGLSVGTHSALVTVSADQMTPVTFTITQVVQSPKGDINQDGQVTPADALYVTKYVQGKITLSDEQKQILDMNDDGMIDAQDAKMIMNIYLGVK